MTGASNSKLLTLNSGRIKLFMNGSYTMQLVKFLKTMPLVRKKERKKERRQTNLF